MMTKGQRIRELRELKGLTLEELASKLNTKKQTIYKYEKDVITNIPSDKIEALSIALNSSPEYILGWDEVEEKNDTLSDIAVRLRTDKAFFNAVSALYKLDADKLENLSAFLK